MDYFNAFAISASGLQVAKSSLDATALNLANLQTVRGADGKLFQPLRVVAGAAGPGFASGFARLAGARVHSLAASELPPRMVYDPGHPVADSQGFVAMAPVDHLTEMANMAGALRMYQANVVALNAAKTMAVKALEIGSY
jgi:flagellar basal-body rod protein FlgC